MAGTGERRQCVLQLSNGSAPKGISPFTRRYGFQQPTNNRSSLHISVTLQLSDKVYSGQRFLQADYVRAKIVALAPFLARRAVDALCGRRSRRNHSDLLT